MSGIGVVLNPHSKRYRNHPEKLKRMGFIVGERGDCAQTNNHYDIRKVAEEFKAKEIDILALSGGDGTNHITLSAFIDIYGGQPLPKITFLRGGTVNTIASGCGIHGSPEVILTNLLYKYHEGGPFEETGVDIMKVNGRYGFIWGLGMATRFMESYYRDGVPSPTHAILMVAKAALSSLVNGPYACRMFERMDGEVWVGEKKWPFRNYSAIFAGSIPYLGLGCRVFYLVRGEGRFHAIGFSTAPRGILRCIPYMALGRPSECPDLIEESAQKMVVRLEEPKAYIIDGEMHLPEREFTIETGPRLSVIVR